MRPLTTIEIIVAVLVVIFAVQFFIVPQKPPSLADAIKSGDILQCDKITNGNDRLPCRNAIQFPVFSKEALEKNNPEICLKIDDEFLRGRCKEPLAAKEAIAKKDVGLCPSAKTAQGTTIFLDEKCPQLIYMNRAIESKDLSLCGKVTDQKLRATCIDVIKSGKPPVMGIFGDIRVATTAPVPRIPVSSSTTPFGGVAPAK